MKIILLLAATFVFTGLAAQNVQIYGKFTKTDGATIKGTSTRRGFENQVIILSYSGGSDNSAAIEIEAPTNTYVAEFRNMMNAAASAASRPAIAAQPGKVIVASAEKANLSDKATLTMTRPTQQSQIAKVEITVGAPNADAFMKPSTKIILEDIKVESCTDNAATGSSRIKLKGSRIGWIYYSYPAGSSTPTSTKSGWDAAANKAWNNF